MSKYGMGVSFAEACRYERIILEGALNRQRKEFNTDEDVWESSPCTKQESVKIALDVFDELAYQAKEFARSSRALEIIMKNHGLELGKGYILSEYMEVIERLKQEDSDAPVISVVK